MDNSAMGCKRWPFWEGIVANGALILHGSVMVLEFVFPPLLRTRKDGVAKRAIIAR